MRNLAGGVAIVTTGWSGGRRGLTMTAITSVSVDYPCLLACIKAALGSHDAVLLHGSFGVNIPGPEHAALALRFAGQGRVHGAAHFDGQAWTGESGNAPLLDPGLCSLDCIVETHQRAGSRGILIGRVIAVASFC